MNRWTIKELKETDDITFAMCILSERRENLNQEAPLAKKLRSAYHTLNSMKEARNKIPRKTCAYCIHGSWFEDRSVGIFGYYECDNPDIPEDFEGDLPSENKDEDCEFFSPLLIKQCGNCGREMDVPDWLWTIWHPGEFGQLPCCCHKCADELDKKERAEYEKMLEDERRYNEQEWKG